MILAPRLPHSYLFLPLFLAFDGFVFWVFFFLFFSVLLHIRGLSFMLGAMSDWVYNRNPTDSLHFEAPLKELKEDLASGKKVRGR